MLVWIIILGSVGYLLYKIIAAVRAARKIKLEQKAAHEKMLASRKPLGHGLFKARENGTGRWAILNEDMEPVTPFKYLNVYRFFNDMMVVDCLQDGQVFGYVDTDGREVIPCQYDTAYPFRENGLAWVKKDRKWGMIDRTGELVVPLQWDVLDLISNEDYDMVRKDGKFGLVDLSGNTLIPAIYDTLYPDHRGFAKAKKDGLWGVLTISGEVKVPIRFPQLKNFTGTRFWVEEKGLWGMWDLNKGMLYPCQWEEVGPGQSGLVYVKKDGRYGMLDENGVWKLDYLWTEVDFDYSGLRDHQRAAVGDLWARLYPDGYILWEEPDRFEDGIAKIILNGRPVRVKKRWNLPAGDLIRGGCSGKKVGTI